MIYTTVSHFPGVNPCVSAWHAKARAVAFVDAQVAMCLRGGEFVRLSYYSHEPPPIAAGTMVRVGGSESHPVNVEAPAIVECAVYEVHLLRVRDQEKCFWRVAQHPVT